MPASIASLSFTTVGSQLVFLIYLRVFGCCLIFQTRLQCRVFLPRQPCSFWKKGGTEQMDHWRNRVVCLEFMRNVCKIYAYKRCSMRIPFLYSFNRNVQIFGECVHKGFRYSSFVGDANESAFKQQVIKSQGRPLQSHFNCKIFMFLVN